MQLPGWDSNPRPLLLYQLHYLSVVPEWIPIFMAHIILVTSSKLSISPGWNQWFDSRLEPSPGKNQWLKPTAIMTNWILEHALACVGFEPTTFAALPAALLKRSAWVNPYLHGTCYTCDICKLSISPGWNPCFDSRLEPSSGKNQWLKPTVIMTNWILEHAVAWVGSNPRPLLPYQLHHWALGVEPEWIPTYRAHVIHVTSCKRSISAGFNVSVLH